LLPEETMSDLSLKRRGVDGRDKPGHDDRAQGDALRVNDFDPISQHIVVQISLQAPLPRQSARRSDPSPPPRAEGPRRSIPVPPRSAPKQRPALGGRLESRA